MGVEHEILRGIKDEVLRDIIFRLLSSFKIGRVGSKENQAMKLRQHINNRDHKIRVAAFIDGFKVMAAIGNFEFMIGVDEYARQIAERIYSDNPEEKG